MTIVWFNGPSQDLLVNSLPPQELEIGCNYIQYKRPVHYVCAYDKHVIDRVKIDPSIEYFTRAEFAFLPTWKPVVDPLLTNTNSGIMALLLATHSSPEPIFLIGCDWGLTDKSVFKYNNIGDRKYTNTMILLVEKIAKRNPIFVVHTHQPDIRLPVIHPTMFLQKITK